MRAEGKRNILFLSILLTMPTSIHAQAGRPVVETPNPADIPQPVPGDVSLAGSDRPDISRFLNVRRAGAPSLSPDGRALAFRTQISGSPQLWVVAADGGWPRQLTFGEAVTFQAGVRLSSCVPFSTKNSLTDQISVLPPLVWTTRTARSSWTGNRNTTRRRGRQSSITGTQIVSPRVWLNAAW